MPGRSWIVVLAVLAVLGFACGGWILGSARTAGDVGVAWSPESPVCEGTTVKDPGSQRPVIRARAGMRCVITVRVTNDSGRTVHVVDAVAPWVGPRTGAVVTAENAEPARRGSEHDIDALLSLDRELGAGRSTEFDVVLVFRPAGCNQGVRFSAERWPTVRVDTWRRTYELQGDKTYSFHRKGSTPGCRNL